MSEDSEEACLVRSPSLQQGGNIVGGSGLSHTMPYGTQGHQSAMNSNGGGGSSGRGSQSHESESGELIDYSDEVLLSQFHADAIKQAGFGKFQLIAAIVTGLGLSGHAIQVYAIFYILPSAEVEYCIVDEQKSWLGNITLLGMGIGALIWGGLAGRSGRRKSLLSCLAVSGVFSVIAAFMPTYGNFMMARFCSAAGIGGVLPAASCYLAELCPTSARTRMLGLFGAFGVAGGLVSGALATVVVPQNGQMVMLENKEHFSAWHRYLLLSTLPTFAAILGLFWLPESPRYLLEAGREVEALSIYQKIYRSNRTRGGYSLTELELPGARGHRQNPPTSVLAGMAHSINLYFGSFSQLANKQNLKNTLLFFAAWTVSIFVYHGLTIYVGDYSKSIASMHYNQNTSYIKNMTFNNVNFNNSIDNAVYTNCRFTNCTFRRMFLSHVAFDNCSLTDTAFANVKTSRTRFKHSILKDTELIDTDLTERHFVDCVIQNMTVLKLFTECDRDFEYNIYLDALWKSHFSSLLPGIVAMLSIGEIVHRYGRSRIATVCFIFSTVLIITLGFLYHDIQVIWTGGTAQGLLLAGLAALTVLAIETYSTAIRGTALGFFICGGHMGALLGAPLYAVLPLTSSKVAAFISTLFMIVPFLSAVILRDTSLLL